MKKKRFLWSCLLLMGWMIGAKGQTKFQNYFSLSAGGCYADWGYANGVAVDASSNYYVAGGILNKARTGGCAPYSNAGYAAISKFNSNGTIAWQNNYDNGNFERSRITHDGYILAAGVHAGTGANYYPCLMKTNSSGTVSWYNSFGHRGQAYDVIETINPSTSAYETMLIGNDDPTYASTSNPKMLLQQVDASGVAGANALIDFNVSGFDVANAAVQTSDLSSLVVTGIGNNELEIFKISYDLTTIAWSHRFTFYNGTGGGAKDYGVYGYSIKQTHDGGFIIAGEMQNTYSPTQITSFLIKLDQYGAISWMKELSSTSNVVSITSVLEDADHNFWLCGRERNATTSVENGLLMKIAGNGSSILLQQVYSINDNWSNYFDLEPTADNGFVMTGFGQIPALSGNPIVQGIILNKTDKYGLSSNTQKNATVSLASFTYNSGTDVWTALSNTITVTNNTPAISSSASYATITAPSVPSSTSSAYTTSLTGADFSYTACAGSTAGNYSFTTTVPSGVTPTYSWNFGDPASGSNTSSLQNPTHQFSGWTTTSNSYNVVLTITNGSDVTIRNVRITYANDLPNANLTVTYPGAGTTVFFDAKTANCDQFIWDYGDGTSPVTVYATPPAPDVISSHSYSSWSSSSDVYTVTIHAYSAGAFRWSGTYHLVYGQDFPTSSDIVMSKSYDCVNEKVSLVITGVNASSDYTYSWENTTNTVYAGVTYDYRGTASHIDNPTDLNAVFDASSYFAQTFRLTATNNQCRTWQQDVSVYPFPTKIPAAVTWNCAGALFPHLDFISDEPAPAVGHMGHSLDITGWATFRPYPDATLSIQNHNLAATSAVPTVICSGTACTVYLHPDDPSYSYGTVNTLDYNWIDNNTGCLLTNTTEFVINAPPVLSVSTSTASNCLVDPALPGASASGDFTASVSWPSGAGYGWNNQSLQLYVIWYETTSPPIPGSPIPSTTALGSSGYMTSTTSSFEVYPTVTTVGVHTYYAVLCIHRAGSFLADEVYMVSSPITSTVHKYPTFSLSGASIISGLNTHICNTQYPDHFNYPTLSCAATNSGSGTSLSTGPYTFIWRNAAGVTVRTYTSSGTASYTDTYTPDPTAAFSLAYMVVIINGNGCYSFGQFYFDNITPASSITGNGYTCPGTTTTLTGNTTSGITSDWHAYNLGTGLPTGSTLATTNIYAAPPGTYQYKATSSGCTHPSAPFTVGSAPALVLTAGMYANPTPGTLLGVNVNSLTMSFYNYVVLHSGSGSSVTLNSANAWSTMVSTDDYYWVTYLDVCSGNYVNTNTVKVAPPCSSYTSSPYDQTYTSTHDIFSGTVNLTSGNAYYVTGTLTIHNGGILNVPASTLVMGECSEIQIEAGGQLNLNGTTIKGCTQWEGIRVLGSSVAKTGSRPYTSNFGNLTITGSTSITDAMNAVYSASGGDIQVSGCTFKNNANHIIMEAYGYDHGANITGCTFGNLITSTVCTQMCSTTVTSNQRMIYLAGVQGVNMGITSTISGTANTFLAPEGTTGFYGIEAFNLTGSTGGSHEISILSNLTSGGYGNTFDGPFNTCVSSTGTSGTLSKGLNLLQNKFGNSGATTHPVNGIILRETDFTKIGNGTIGNNNDIENMTNGIQFYANNTTASSGGNTIYGNSIIGNMYGIVVAPVDYPITSSTGGAPLNGGIITTMQLNIWCNRIEGNTRIGIVGTGNIISQTNGGSQTASNKFSGTGGSNTYADLIWQGTLNYFIISGFIVNNTLTSGPTFYMNNLATPVTGCSAGFSFTSLSPFSNQGCFTSLLKRGETGIANTGEEDDHILVYPNPASDKFIIRLPESANETYSLVVFDVLGQKIVSEKLTGRGIKEINVSGWTPGVYMLTLVNSEGKTYQNRVEVQR